MQIQRYDYNDKKWRMKQLYIQKNILEALDEIRTFLKS